MAVEVEAELGDLGRAVAYVVRARERARDGCFVMHEDGTPDANYEVGLYTSFDGLEEAREACLAWRLKGPGDRILASLKREHYFSEIYSYFITL
jgi:hypothetical protein